MEGKIWGFLLNADAVAAEIYIDMKNIQAIFHSAQAVKETVFLNLVILKTE